MPVTLIKTVRIGGNYTKAQLSVADWNGTGQPLKLKQGQLAIEKDTGKGKWGDGITAYSALDYVFYEGVPGGKVIIPITNGFSYDTGYINPIPPPMATYLKTGTSLTPYGVPTYDTATGIITSDLYNGVDDYVLVVG